MRKKGGMELSINAIVILIIAMVVLGIGILFIRGMFAKAQVTTFKALTSQETTNPASADRPLIADREVTISNTNPTATLAVSVYNTGTSPATDIKINISNCIASSTGTDVTSSISFTPVTDAAVPSNQFSSFQTVIGMKKNATAYPFSAGDSIVCNLKSGSATNSNLNLSTSVVIRVQSAG